MAKESSSGTSGTSGGSSGGTKTDGSSLFDASSTSLFKNGIKVGELDRDLTIALNMLTKDFDLTTLSVGENDVSGDITNYLITVKSCSAKLSLTTSEKLTLIADVKLYCKLSDDNSGRSSREYRDNLPLPENVKLLAENKIKADISALFTEQKNSGCDFLKVKEKLYRYRHDDYERLKDKVNDFNYLINVVVAGQT